MTDLHSLIFDLLCRRAAPGRLRLLLDYDGTLVPIAARPEHATPDADLLRLLYDLRRSVDVHIVSGRSCDELQEWFGALAIDLWAEHGAFHYPAGGGWSQLAISSVAWLDVLRRVFDDVAAGTPGSFVEEKRLSLAWHYRLADPNLASCRAGELRRRVAAIAPITEVDVLDGDKVVEVRPARVSKAMVVQRVAPRRDERAFVAAFGDDRTDEQMFGGVLPEGVAVRVGAGPSIAIHRVQSTTEVRSILRALAGFTAFVNGFPQA